MAWYLVELRYMRDRVDAVRPRHRNYLAGLAREGRLSFAGRLADDSGGVFLYQAADEAELAGLMDNDPYWPEGVVAERSVREFVPGVAFEIPPLDSYGD